MITLDKNINFLVDNNISSIPCVFHHIDIFPTSDFLLHRQFAPNK